MEFMTRKCSKHIYIYIYIYFKKRCCIFFLGVALLSHPFDATKAEERRKKKEEGAQAIAAATNTGPQANHMLPSHGHGPVGPGAGGVRRPLGSHSARRNDAPTGARQTRYGQ